MNKNFNDSGCELTIKHDVVLAQKGDQQAFTRLVEQTQNTVTSIALAIVKDIDASEDVAQKVFISIWGKLGSLKNTQSFLPWLRQTTRYTAYNFLRDSKTMSRATSEETDQILAEFADSKLSLEEDMHHHQQKVIMNDFIEQLPDESKEVVLLYYREQQSTKQVAVLLEITEANVRKKLSRARVNLKGMLMEKYGKLILSTAPAFTFTTLISSAVSSSPAVAASMTQTLVTTKTSSTGKLLVLMGGAIMGALLAIVAVLWSTQSASKKMSCPSAKQELLKYRNMTIAWIIFSSLLLTASYELSSGWLAPVLAYIIFSLGLSKLIWMNNKLVKPQHFAENKTNMNHSNRSIVTKLACLFGSFMGLVLGFTGLIIGLLNSGRLIL